MRSRTKKRTYYGRCPECGAYPALCSECGAKTTGSTPFSDWLRELPPPHDSGNYDIENLDFVVFAFRKPPWFITIEEKMWWKRTSMAQEDTHSVLAQLLKLGSDLRRKIDTLRGKRTVVYRGHYEISFQKTTPDNSTLISINGKEYRPSVIFDLLNTGSLEGIPTIYDE